MMSKVTISEDYSSESEGYTSSDIDIKDELPSGDENTQNESDSDLEVKKEFAGVMDGNAGMAAVMAKILRKSAATEKAVIMSKSLTERQLASRKRKHLEKSEDGGGAIEVVKAEGELEIKTELLESVNGERKQKKNKKMTSTAATIKLKKEKDELCHHQPDPLDRNKELNLIKIATRGVVQLFNAVKSQQGKVRQKVSEAGKSIRKADKAISKFTSGDFLDDLKAQKVKTVSTGVNSSAKGDKNDVKPESEAVKEEPAWDVLKDDYMLGSQSMRDWDKESDDDVPSGEIIQSDSESE